jgi:molybdate transport system permease protein
VEETAAALDALWISLRVAALSLGLSIVPGVGVGYLLARWSHPLRSMLQALVMLPLVLPPVVTGALLLWLFGRSRPLGQLWHALTGSHIAYTTSACVLAACVVGFPLLVESTRIAFGAVDRRLEAVARTLGRGPLDTFFRVTLPIATPGLLAGAVLAFARGLGEFGATIVIAGDVAGETRTIPIAVYGLLAQRGGDAAAARLVAASVALSLAALAAASLIQARQRRRAGN